MADGRASPFDGRASPFDGRASPTLAAEQPSTAVETAASGANAPESPEVTAARAAPMYSAAHAEPKTAAASGADISSKAPVANGNGPTTGSESGTRAGAVVPRSRRRHQLHRAQSLRGAVRA